MVKTSSGDRFPLLLKSPRRCCRGGEGFSLTSYQGACQVFFAALLWSLGSLLFLKFSFSFS